uniref:Cilia- and flagella-associated protein 45 n=1 Tax=Arion vulgaris TaxID=1028688 RepID=A0A0B7A4H8_9EUPU
MPSSANSVSGGSNGSRRGKTRQYRTVNQQSHIDECLFGDPQSQQIRHAKLKESFLLSQDAPASREGIPIERLANERSTHRRSGQGKKQKELVTVITKDLIRKLIVPSEDPSGDSIIIPREQFFRILQASKVLSKEEREAEAEKQRQEKERAMDDAQERKNRMKLLDVTRQKNAKLNDLEEEAKERAEHLLTKANELRQEQEDEIKKLNEAILSAKCHAIRDAQILEKDQIKKEMTDEEKRLDIMMEVDRQNAIKLYEEIEKRKKEEQLLGAAKLLEQIDEIEQEKLLELERKDQENLQMQRYIEKLMEEDQETLERKKLEQESLREELNKANAELLKRKELKTLQDKAEELKVLEFQKQKAEREAAFEKEQEKIRVEKEREVAKLRGLQERAKDEQAERDALRAKRAQEQAERDWRRKEADEAKKKAELEDSLKKARTMQMQQKEHFMAVQAQRERLEFERVLRAQKELVDKQKREEEAFRKKKYALAVDVRAQIREKEQDRIAERNAFFEEGIKLDEEAKARRLKLEAMKKKKLNELRDAGIPDKYLAEVERKINQPQKIMA